MFGNHLIEEERASFFTLIVLLLSCVCLCFLIPRPLGTTGWSEIMAFLGHTHLFFY